MKRLLLALLLLLPIRAAADSIYLTGSTESIQVSTSSSAVVSYRVSYEDDYAGRDLTKSSKGSISSATTTTIVAAPTATTQRRINWLNIQNESTTTANTVQLLLDVNGTDYKLTPPIALAAKESLSIDVSGRLVTYDLDGLEKTNVTGGGGGGMTELADDTTPTLGGNLDAANYTITHVGDITFEGLVTVAPAVNTTTAVSPTQVPEIDEENWFSIDGEKAPVEGEGGGLLKTKTIGRRTASVNLSESEHYGVYNSVYAGGDTDTVGVQYDVFCTGGAHASGDEGCQIHRQYAQDYWITAVGTVSSALSSGSGDVTVGVGSITESESRMLGENKWAVFTGGEVAVDIVDAPPGTYEDGVLEDSGTSWSFDGSATGQGVWTLGSGQVTSSGVQSTGWCFSAVDSDYNDMIGTSTAIWLPISAINSGTDTVTTRWENQGYNGKTPFPYLASENDAGTEARVAPCAEMAPPTFAGGAGDFVADSITLRKATGFPGALSGATFVVAAYPNTKLSGSHVLLSNQLGGMYDSSGHESVNLADGSDAAGRFQQGSAFDATYSSSAIGTYLKDGKKAAWKRGLDCSDFDSTGAACETGIDFYYAPDPSDTGLSHWLAEIEWSSEDWSDDTPRTVVRVNNDSAANVTLDKTDGLGQNGDAFARLAAAQTFATGTKTVTSKFDFGGGTLEIPNSTSLPGSCAVGDSYMDTDATSGQRFYLCESSNTWVLQGDGGGGGGGDNARVEDSDNAGTFTAATDADFEDSGDINFVLDTASTPDQISAQIRSGAVGTTEAAALDTGDITTGAFADARVDGSLESDEVTGLADSQISDTLTASTSTTAAANDNDTSIATTAFVQQEIDDGDLLSDNCVLENDSTPIPDSCVGDGTDGGGGGSLPTVDTTSIAEGSGDATKEVRFEVDGITTGTVRVLTMPDADVNLGALTSSLVTDGTLTGDDVAASLAGDGLTKDTAATPDEIDVSPGLGLRISSDTVGLDPTAALSGDHTLNADEAKFGANGLIFEGATSNTIEMYVAVPDPATSDKTLTLPNVTGTLVSTGDTGTVTSTMISASLVDADMANDALDADKVVGDATDDDDLDVAAGGTGASTFTSNAVLLGNTTSDIQASVVTIASGAVDGVTTLDADGAVTGVSFTSDATASPTLTLDDSDSASETSDATITAAATDTGAGTEDVDVAINTQVNSTLTARLTIDADGRTQINNAALEVDATDPSDSGAVRLDNAEGIGWEASPTGTDVLMAADASEVIQITGGTLDAADLSGTVPDASINGANEADELVLAGDVDGTANANDIDEASVEGELEGVIDILDLQDGATSGCTGSQIVRRNAGDTAFECATAGGGFTSFNADGDNNSPQTISDGNELLIAGDASGIDTSAGATDTVTVSYDATEAETANEGVLDLDQLQGSVTDGQVPDALTLVQTAETGIDALGLEFEPGDALTDCSTYSATGGGIFYDDSEGKLKKCQDNTLSDLDTGGGSGAPTTVDYLVGTADGGLSAEIVVGTSPGGELGGTWASPTLDDSVTVSTWTLTAPVFSAGSATAASWPDFGSGTLLTAAEDGVLEQDTEAFYLTTDADNRGYVAVRHCIRADSTRALTSSASEQALFNSPTNGRLTLETGAYRFFGNLAIGATGTAMSATSGNAALDPVGAGTATTGSWLYQVDGIDATTITNADTQSGTWVVTQQTAASMVTAGTGTALAAQFEGTFEVTTGGTVIPSVTLVTAAAATVSAGTHICFERIGSTSMTNVGQWD